MAGTVASPTAWLRPCLLAVVVHFEYFESTMTLKIEKDSSLCSE
jgi:hypothetical protein